MCSEEDMSASFESSVLTVWIPDSGPAEETYLLFAVCISVYRYTSMNTTQNEMIAKAIAFIHENTQFAVYSVCSKMAGARCHSSLQDPRPNSFDIF